MTDTEQQSWERKPEGSGVETALSFTGFVLILMGVILGLILLFVLGERKVISSFSRSRFGSAGLTSLCLCTPLWTALFHIVPGLICLGMGKGIRVLKEIRSGRTTEDAAAAQS